jgi:hypothetical protein
MPSSPSLLDWLQHKLGQPRGQRLVRFGLAALSVASSVRFLRGGEPLVAFFLLGLSVGLVF